MSKIRFLTTDINLEGDSQIKCLDLYEFWKHQSNIRDVFVRLSTIICAEYILKKSSLASQRNFSAKRNIVIQILETFGGTFDKERRNSWKVFVARRNFF